jgi:hypothetical protein
VTSYRDIEIVLHDPEIIKKLGRKPSIKKIIDMTHIGCYVDNRIVSLMYVEPNKKGHFCCLKPYRKQAVDFAKASLKLAPRDIWFSLPNKNLENFAKKIGFVKSGVK